MNSQDQHLKEIERSIQHTMDRLRALESRLRVSEPSVLRRKKDYEDKLAALKREEDEVEELKKEIQTLERELENFRAAQRRQETLLDKAENRRGGR